MVGVCRASRAARRTPPMQRSPSRSRARPATPPPRPWLETSPMASRPTLRSRHRKSLLLWLSDGQPRSLCLTTGQSRRRSSPASLRSARWRRTDKRGSISYGWRRNLDPCATLQVCLHILRVSSRGCIVDLKSSDTSSAVPKKASKNMRAMRLPGRHSKTAVSSSEIAKTEY